MLLACPLLGLEGGGESRAQGGDRPVRTHKWGERNAPRVLAQPVGSFLAHSTSGPRPWATSWPTVDGRQSHKVHLLVVSSLPHPILSYSSGGPGPRPPFPLSCPASVHPILSAF